MTWIKLDDNFSDHPKVLQAGPLASWLYVCGLAYAARYLTDGFIPARQVRKLADLDGADGLAAALVDAGLWDPVQGGYTIHDYLEYNPSSEQVKVRREKDALRKAPPRSGSRRNPRGKGAESVGPVPVSVPVPIPPPQPGVPSVAGRETSGTDEHREILMLLGSAGQEADRPLVEKTIATYGDRDPRDVALDYLRWQARERRRRDEGQKGAIVLSDHVKGWSRAMHSAKERGLYPRREASLAEEPAPEVEVTGVAPFDDMRRELSQSIGAGNYRSWFAPLRVASADDAVLRLEAEDEFQRAMLEQRLLPVVTQALRITGHDGLRVEFSAAGSQGEPVTAER